MPRVRTAGGSIAPGEREEVYEDIYEEKE